MRFKLILGFIVVMAVGSACSAAPFKVASPGGVLTAVVDVDGAGRLTWSLSRGSALIVSPSAMGVTVDGVDYGLVSEVKEAGRVSINETYKARDRHAKAVNRCNEARFSVKPSKGAGEMELTMRVYDDGAAYRYAVPGAGTRRVSGEATAWRIPAEDTIWYQNNLLNYEGEFTKVEAGEVKPGTRIGAPFTIVLPDNAGYASVTEGALFKYSGMSLLAGEKGFQAEFADDPGGWSDKGEIRSPWRITIVSPDLNGLFNSDIIMNVNELPTGDLAKADWIKPGRCLWSWLNGARSSVTPENMRFYVDAAKQLGFECVLVDEGWEGNTPKEKPYEGWGETLDQRVAKIAELVKYGSERGVKIWVWKHHFMLKVPAYRADFFKRLSKVGVVGVKIDFMDSESREMVGFYEDTLRDAAKYKLMINFHGANKPTGESRKYPNEAAREGVRGLEYRALYPDYNCTLPFTRFIAGHGDYTPMHFKREWMTLTSWPHQIATAIIFPTFVTFYGGHPQDYLDSPARDVIEKLPTTWDETIVLPMSKIGKIAAFARRKGDTWFVAIMNGGSGRSFDLPLNFLGAGRYELTAVSDSMASSLALKEVKREVGSGDSAPVRMRMGGGYAAMLTKKK